MMLALTAGVLEVAVAMAEVGKRHRQAAKDAVAARRQLQAEAGKGIVLPSGVRPFRYSDPKAHVF